jgi:hypothetical protein
LREKTATYLYITHALVHAVAEEHQIAEILDRNMMNFSLSDDETRVGPLEMKVADRAGD